MYATDSMHNAVHSSSNKEKATEIIEEFFPEIELNPDGTVKGKVLQRFNLVKWKTEMGERLESQYWKDKKSWQVVQILRL